MKNSRKFWRMKIVNWCISIQIMKTINKPIDLVSSKNLKKILKIKVYSPSEKTIILCMKHQRGSSCQIKFASFSRKSSQIILHIMHCSISLVPLNLTFSSMTWMNTLLFVDKHGNFVIDKRIKCRHTIKNWRHTNVRSILGLRIIVHTCNQRWMPLKKFWGKYSKKHLELEVALCVL